MEWRFQVAFRLIGQRGEHLGKGLLKLGEPVLLEFGSQGVEVDAEGGDFVQNRLRGRSGAGKGIGGAAVVGKGLQHGIGQGIDGVRSD